MVAQEDTDSEEEEPEDSDVSDDSDGTGIRDLDEVDQMERLNVLAGKLVQRWGVSAEARVWAAIMVMAASHEAEPFSFNHDELPPDVRDMLRHEGHHGKTLSRFKKKGVLSQAAPQPRQPYTITPEGDLLIDRVNALLQARADNMEA